MTIQKLLFVLFISVALAACTGTSDSGGGNGNVTFTIILSANCDGRVGSVDIFFDDRFVATLTPSGSTDVTTQRGIHNIEGRGDNGSTFGPIQRDIQADGSTQTFTCNT